MKPQLIYNQFLNKYTLRGNSNKFTCKLYFNNEAWHNSFFYRSVEIWNKLPNELVSCKKVEEFRFKLKKFDLNKVFLSKINK